MLFYMPYLSFISKPKQKDEQKDSCYMPLAISCMKYARSVVNKGSTRLENNQLSIEEREKLSTDVNAMRNCVAIQRDNWIQHINKYAQWLYNSSLDSSVYFYLCFTHTLLTRLGNCMELSAVTLYYALKVADKNLLHSDTYHLAEIVQTKDETHALIIFGRLRNSDLDDPATWGNDAVICDPWANSCYPASRMKDNLRAFSQDEKRINHQIEISLPDENLSPVKIFDSSWNTDALLDNEVGLEAAKQSLANNPKFGR
jgi:hypothetical protein